MKSYFFKIKSLSQQQANEYANKIDNGSFIGFIIPIDGNGYSYGLLRTIRESNFDDLVNKFEAEAISEAEFRNEAKLIGIDYCTSTGIVFRVP